MSTRERILTIRLLEKVEKYPAYTKVLGLKAVKEKLLTPAPNSSQTTGMRRK